MEIVKYFLFLLFLYVSVFSESKPFNSGYSMINGKALILPNDISGRDPVISSVYSGRERSLALSTSYLYYYLKSGNDCGLRDERAVFGLTAISKRGSLKLAFEYFSFMGLYLEKELLISFAYSITKKLRGGVNFSYCNSGLLIDNYPRNNSFLFSGTALMDISRLLFSLELGGLLYSMLDDGFIYDKLYVDIIGSSVTGKIINQGVRLNFRPKEVGASRFFWSLSAKTIGSVYIHLTVATNPMLFGAGLTFRFGNNGMFFGSSTHPVLGTSLGIGMEHLILKR